MSKHKKTGEAALKLAPVFCHPMAKELKYI